MGGLKRTAVLAALVAVATACSGARLQGSESVSAGPGSAGGTAATVTTAVGGATPGATTVDATGNPVGTGAGGGTVGTTAGGGTDPATGGTVVGPQFVSTLFAPEEDTKGITDAEIRLCAHAALTYGAAFNTSADDLNVYWTAVNEAGGVYGRSVQTYYENDNYTPDGRGQGGHGLPATSTTRS